MSKESIIKKWFVLILALSLAAYIVFALSSVNVNSPTTGQNVDGTITLNATTDIAAVNVTFRWQDSSGSFVLNTTIYNDTASDTVFENTSFDTTLLSDGIYNLTVNATNLTGSTVANNSITGITVDNTPPVVSSISNPITGSNLSTGTQVFNATVSDTTLSVDVVLFNITNGSSSVVLTASNPSGNFWNSSVDLGSLDEEQHTVTVLANDSLGNLNNTESTAFTVDRTAPTVTLVNSSFNTTDTTPSVTFNFTDAQFATASCVLYFNNTAYDTSTANNATNTALTVNTTLSDGSYSASVNCTDGSGNEGSSSSITVTIDSGAPAVTIFNSPASGSYNNNDFILNVTVTGTPTTVQYRIENGTNSSVVEVNYTSMTNIGGNFWNSTIDVSALTDGNYTIRINATNALGNSNTTETLLVNIDDTNPSITSFSCDDVNKGVSQSCSCSSTDNSQNFGGSVSASISSASTATTGTKTVTCTATDTAGNIATSDTTYTVSSSSSGGGGGTVPSNPKNTHIWQTLNSDELVTLGIDSKVGFTELTFNVKESLTNVKITIIDFSLKIPETLPQFNGASVYRYLEVNQENMNDANLKGKVKIKFKVEKSWLTKNNIDKNNVALFRYTTEWTELPASKIDSDSIYVYYESETPGFSYFAIGQKTVVPEEVIEVPVEEVEVEETPPVEEVAPPEEELVEEPAREQSPWLTVFIIIIIVIIALYMWWDFSKKKK